MRCPKCKFISFDDLSNCAKCANDLSALAAELNGTCKETHLEFFLGSVVQAQNLEEKDFSDSQPLPPIDQDDINFDDTSTGRLPAYTQKGEQAENIDFNESAEINREDDISIELGDIMPIDLDQLDLSSVMAEESSDTLAAENKQDEVSTTTSIPEDDIDLNLTDEFANDNLDLELNESISDIDLDDTTLAAGDDTTVIHAPAPDVSDASGHLLTDSEDFSAEELDSQFDLDDELIAELAESSGDFDSTAALSESTGENDSIKFSSPGDFSTDNTLDLDDSLLAELSEDKTDTDDVLSVSENEHYVDFSESEAENQAEGFTEVNEAESEPELSSLDFGDIDVSDLVASSPSASQVDSEIDSPQLESAVDDSGREDFAPAEETVETIQQPALEATTVDDENIIFNEIDELELDDLNENDLAMLDVTGGLDDDTGDLDITTEEPMPNGAVAEIMAEAEKSDEDLPEAELLLDDEEEIPPDLPN